MNQVGIGTRVINFLTDTAIISLIAFILNKVWVFYVVYWNYSYINPLWIFAAVLFIYYFIFDI